MPLNFTYTQDKNIHTLKNNELFPFDYSVKRIECDATTTLKEGTVTPGETVTITYTFDGKYEIELSTLTENTTIPDILITKNLLDSIISLAEKVLCGCSRCNDCEECTDCEDYLHILVKVIALNQITHPKYSATIQLLMTQNSCLFNESVLLCLKTEKIYGNAEVKSILLQIISYYYLGFYAVDLEEAVDKEYVTELYKFSKIAKCIRKLGVLENPISPASIFNPVFNSIFK